VDLIVAREVDQPAEAKKVKAKEIPSGWKGLDIGPETVRQFSDMVRKARTIFWNGPMGVFENEHFAGGTEAMARILAEVTRGGATTVAGGGDTVAALNAFGLKDAMSHVSTGGGAAMEFLEGLELPGVAALSDAS
jgi:phosphoglycerate kinase